MAHKDSKWPKKEITLAIKKQNSARLYEFFNTGQGKKLNKSRFFHSKYYQPKNIIFQHMSFKEHVFNAIKNRWEEMSRFRKDYIRQHLTSVGNEEIARVGPVLTEFFDGFICDNLDYHLFEKFVLDTTARRNKYKK